MAMIPVFRALVTPEGKVRLRETERAARQQWLESLAGHEVEILIRRPPRQRTLDQGAYLHAVPFRLIAHVTGESIPQTKRNVMGACFGWRGLAPLIEPWMQHTSDLTDDDASYLIDWIGPFGLEKFGIEIPLPGEVAY